MSRVRLNYWPSLLLSLVLLVGIATCLKRLDYLVIEEVRALISILFGFATSCLLLSFFWLIRKPLNNPWPTRHITIGADLPIMNPRGRTSSYESDQAIISTISNGNLDVPPAYEDALTNSKPVYRSAGPEKPSNDTRNQRQQSTTCNCINSVHNQHRGATSSRLACVHCPKDQRPHEAGVKHDRKISAPSTGFLLNRAEPARSRKISFVQLDVNQLAAHSSSPPKYHELHFYTSGELHLHRDADKITIDLA